MEGILPEARSSHLPRGWGFPSATLKGSCGLRTGSLCQFCGQCSHKVSTQWTGVNALLIQTEEPPPRPPLLSAGKERCSASTRTSRFPNCPIPCPAQTLSFPQEIKLNGDSHQEEAKILSVQVPEVPTGDFWRLSPHGKGSPGWM